MRWCLMIPNKCGRHGDTYTVMPLVEQSSLLELKIAMSCLCLEIFFSRCCIRFHLIVRSSRIGKIMDISCHISQSLARVSLLRQGSWSIFSWIYALNVALASIMFPGGKKAK
ncbi:hypothetical protein BDZ85DRAFT_266704 [Elsinoe ampelina]|uniref:Uncharacterized protein n=1 Tax=Elsinoe ampelina TaxID=302913 RepID=A0A6A6G436_9PEZI|nr:hypothetical protein BDZ85DRAFT_266704 [Elsinoe ampelina]